MMITLYTMSVTSSNYSAFDVQVDVDRLQIVVAMIHKS